MNCPKCKKQIDKDSQFCEYCGAKIEKSKRGLWITLAVIALIAIVGVGVYMHEAQQEILRIERQRLEEENRRAAERQAELEAQLEAERIAKEKAEQARRAAEQKAKAEAEARKAKTKGTANGHEWVDLALPSGTKWATKNVGATTPEGYGDYYAWGETTTKSTYDWSTYKWCNGTSDYMTKYCISSSQGIVDNVTTLDLSDDAAYVNWGNSWRMPTKAELDELRQTYNCVWEWITQNGVIGYKVTSKKNGNSIFLPATGYRYDTLEDEGFRGCYWSSSLSMQHSSMSYHCYYRGGSVYDNDSRCFGYSIRPVLR